MNIGKFTVKIRDHLILVRYILRNHFLPFIAACFILISVFLLQFLMKYADKLIGKGLSGWIITQLIIYNLAWMVVLVAPMAVLIATLMAFGNMSQNNEVAIMKASGISLYKMISPPLIASFFVAVFLVYFNNRVYPDANHAARVLMEDISRKKPTLSLVPGVFSQDVASYAILVRDINQKTNELGDITIYDYSTPPKINIVTASKGKIYFAASQKKLIMDLNNGEIHESDNNAQKSYRRLRFSHHKIAMNAEQFSFEQSNPGGPRGDRELGAPEMVKKVDSLKVISDSQIKELKSRVMVDESNLRALRFNQLTDKSNVYIKIKERMRSHKGIIDDILMRMDYNHKEIDRYTVEIHKKYALPVACIVFVLIGAPLGTMTRKGGIGMASGISLFFFVVYWAFLIGGEKLADRNLLSPWLGIWGANIVLGTLGILLLIKTTKERITLNFDFVTKLIPKSWKPQEENNENS